MNPRSWAYAIVLVCLLGGSLMASSPASGQQTTVVLGTATPGGGFPQYGDAMIAAVRAADPALTVEPRNTKGSFENIPMLEAGQLDLGLVQGEAAYEALAGIGRAPAKLTILAAMYSSAGFFIVRGDSAVRAIADLTGKPVAFGAKGSGLIILAKYVLDGMGLDRDKDFDAVFLERAGDGPAMVLDGRVAALWGGGQGWPGFTKVAEAGGRFIAPSPEERTRIRAKHTFLKALTMPANSYPGQTVPLESVGSWSFVMARPTLDDDTAYRLARALFKGETDATRNAQVRDTTAANLVAAAPRQDLIHPGVLRYLRETGAAR
jgi:TRAP transporter TAXI family solute receptor